MFSDEDTFRLAQHVSRYNFIIWVSNNPYGVTAGARDSQPQDCALYRQRVFVLFFFFFEESVVTSVMYLDVEEFPYADFGRRVLKTCHCNKKAQSVVAFPYGSSAGTFSIESFLGNGLAQATLSFGRLVPVTSHHFSSSYGGT